MNSLIIILFAALGAAFTDLVDGCVIIKAAVVSAAGGNPRRWGITFGLCHGLFGALGAMMSAQISHQSQSLADLISMGAVTFLLVRLWSHKRQCAAKHCGHERQISDAVGIVIITTAALSADALATGAVLRGVLSQFGMTAVLAACLIEAAIVGLLISIFSSVGEHFISRLKEHRVVSKLPFVLLFATLCYLFDQLLDDFVNIPQWIHISLLFFYVLAAMLLIFRPMTRLTTQSATT